MSEHDKTEGRHKPAVYIYDNGEREVPCDVLRDNGDGTADIHAAEAGSNAVKLFSSVPEGTGGLTYRKA